MVNSGELDKVSQAAQKLTSKLQGPQSVFGLDQLESMTLKARTNSDFKAGLDKMVLDRKGAEGLGKVGRLLQSVRQEPNQIRQQFERVLQQPTTQSTLKVTQPGSSSGQPTTVAQARPGAASSQSRKPESDKGVRETASLGGLNANAPTRANEPAPAASQTVSPSKASRPQRSMEFRKVFNILREVTTGAPNADKHPAKLAEMSASKSGAHAVADAMEATIVAQPDQMLDTFDEMVKTQESRKAFAKTLSNVAEAAPDRMAGILLLASDVEGGKQALANLLTDLSAPESAGSLGKMMASASSSEQSANGMKELFTTLLKPEGEDHSVANQTARALAQTSRTKEGAEGVARTLSNLMKAEGGPRDVGSMIRTMSQTPEGTKATTEMLLNLSADKKSAKELGKVLARASKSEAGGRDLLKTFQKMGKTDAGKQELSKLFVRLTDDVGGARLLANLSRDKGNAKQLGQLLSSFKQSPQAAARMGQAIQQALHQPNASAEMALFRGRAAVEATLKEALVELTQSPVAQAPLQLSESARGANAMARLTAFENLARAVAEKPAQPEIRTVNPSGASPSGGTTDGSQSSAGNNSQEPRMSAGYQPQPYPDLAIVSDVWRTQNMVRADGGERLAEMASGATSDQAEQKHQQNDRNTAFRPGDVYSDMTLLRARICGDCGFRTNSIGECSRCGYSLLD